MENRGASKSFDVIIVGSGTCGSTIARELTNQGRRVLLLERGGNPEPKESLPMIASIINQVPVTDKLKDMRVFATGGSTAMYLAVTESPPLDAFAELGIDLSGEAAEAERELPVDFLPDELIGTQAHRLRESAEKLGYSWHKKKMLVEKQKCRNEYSYDAKWKARTFALKAVEKGAILANHARVRKVLVENGKAIGVEYSVGTALRRHNQRRYAEKVVLAAGSLATPIILRDSGIRNVLSRGFYIGPSSALYGVIPGLNAGNNFAGSMGAKLDDDIELIDANLHKLYFRFGMAGSLRFSRILAYSSHIGIGIKIRDKIGGTLSPKNRFNKEITADDLRLLKAGEDVAVKILKEAGAKDILNFGMMATGAFGTVVIGEHVDSNLQTEIENLYVCDGSILPEGRRVTPVLTLVSLGKFMSKILLN